MSNPTGTAKPTVEITDAMIIDGRLFGEATNHPRLGNTSVATSAIVNYDSKNNTVETMNTMYKVLSWSPSAPQTATDMPEAAV